MLTINGSSRDELIVLQLSDMHLHSEDSTTLHGHKTNNKFNRLINHIHQYEVIKPDVIFLTGDISQDMSEASYDVCLHAIKPLDIDTYWLAGNHDDPTIAHRVFSNSKRLKPLIRLNSPYWDFIFVNSCREGTDKGYIHFQELERVEAELRTVDKTKSICLVMHHHPIPVSTPLIDECILQDSAYFLDRLKKYPAIKLIMCGHVHGDYSLTFEEIQIESSPATCFQWKKGTNKLETEEDIGYTFYRMRKNAFTKITRKISPVENNRSDTFYTRTL